MSRINLNKWLF